MPELAAQVEKLDAEAAQHMEASVAAQEDHREAQEALQVRNTMMRC